MNDIEQAPENLREWRISAGDKVRAAGATWPAPKNDRLLRAARGEPNDRPPKWMMRQAGRYLPEYMALLKNSDFFTVCETPTLAAEVTLQPFRRYPSLDSLIIFSDILVVPAAMGMPCKMVPAVGPQFDFAIETPEDLAKLNFTPDVKETLGYVFDAVFWTRQRVNNEVPVIGFSGAPWTLMGYMVEGGAVRSFDRAKKWLYLYPEESRRLLKALREIIVEYLIGQYDAGAPLLTVFDTNCGQIPPSVYEDFCVEDLKYIATEVKRQRPKALMTVFPKDGEMGVFNDSAFDVVGVSWTASPRRAREQCPDKTLQGNLDPHVLYADPKVIKAETERMAYEFGVDRYIANLGHGMLPNHPVEGPKAFIDAIDGIKKSESRAAAEKPKEAPKKAAAAPSGAPPSLLTLHLEDDTTVSVPFTTQAANDLQLRFNEFRTMFKKKMNSEKVQKWDDFDVLVELPESTVELYCNPNAFATIFDVKMFLTVKCGTAIKISSAVPLSTLQSDLEAYAS